MFTHYLRIQRPETGTVLTVKCPLSFSQINEQISHHLNSWVDLTYPGFEIFSFWGNDQKKMHETQYE
jgi:hypothetical protein